MFTLISQVYDRIFSIRFFRFALIGGFSGGIYALVVVLLNEITSIGHVMASVIGYLAAIPTNFIGQRRFAFRSAGNVKSEFPKFLVVQLVNTVISAISMYAAVDLLALPYLVGIALVIATIPFSTYMCLKVFVFVSTAVKD